MYIMYVHVNECNMYMCVSVCFGLVLCVCVCVVVVSAVCGGRRAVGGTGA